MNVSAVSSSPPIPSPKPPVNAAPASTPASSGPGLSASSLAPGLYVHVIDGIINLANSGGPQAFSAGQFGYIGQAVQAPVVVPTNPGIQFSPLPAFSSPTSNVSLPSVSTEQTKTPTQIAIEAYTSNLLASTTVPKTAEIIVKPPEAAPPVIAQDKPHFAWTPDQTP